MTRPFSKSTEFGVEEQEAISSLYRAFRRLRPVKEEKAMQRWGILRVVVGIARLPFRLFRRPPRKHPQVNQEPIKPTDDDETDPTPSVALELLVDETLARTRTRPWDVQDMAANVALHQLEVHAKAAANIAGKEPCAEEPCAEEPCAEEPFLQSLGLTGPCEEAPYEPHERFCRSRVGFSFLLQSAHQISRLNADIPFDASRVMYMVLYTGGWCILDPHLACFLRAERMAAIGLADVCIQQVWVLPWTRATLGLVHAVLNDQHPSHVDFLMASLRVRMALQAGGLGVDTSNLTTQSYESEADAGDEIRSDLPFPRRHQGSVSAPPLMMHVQALAQLLVTSIEFCYGASLITVSQLYDGMIDMNTQESRVFMNLGCTLELFREIIAYMCLEVREGLIQHMRWRSGPPVLETHFPALLSGPVYEIADSRRNLDLRCSPHVDTSSLPRIPWNVAPYAEHVHGHKQCR